MDYGNTKTLHTGQQTQKLGSAVLWLLTFPGREKQPEFPVHCTGTRKLSNLLLRCRKFGPPDLGKTTAAHKSSATQSYKCMLGLLALRKPPNSDMDYRILSLRCVRDLSYTVPTGVGHTDSESAHFRLSVCCAPDRIRTRVMECTVRRSTNGATPPPLWRISETYLRWTSDK